MEKELKKRKRSKKKKRKKSKKRKKRRRKKWMRRKLRKKDKGLRGRELAAQQGQGDCLLSAFVDL